MSTKDGQMQLRCKLGAINKQWRSK